MIQGKAQPRSLAMSVKGAPNGDGARTPRPRESQPPNARTRRPRSTSLRACFNIVAADVRRRRFGQLSSGNPPPHVGGYGVLKHVLKGKRACECDYGAASDGN